MAWGDLEAELGLKHGWYELSEAERLAHPGRGALVEIDKQVDELSGARDALLSQITRVRADTLDAILLKAKVLAEIVDPVDAPEGHALINSLRRDLSDLFANLRG